MTKKNKILLCSYIIVKRNANTTDSIRSGIKNGLEYTEYTYSVTQA